MEVPVLISAIVILVFVSSGAEAGKWLTNENGKRFYVETEEKFTWSEAVNKCNQMNMELISMDSQEKTQEVNNLIRTNFLDNAYKWFWTGGHDHNVSRHFKWISTSESFGYTNWRSSFPNDVSRHCVLMGTFDSLKWIDHDCNNRRGLVCEENPLQKVTNAELRHLKASFDNQTNLLKEKIEQLDSLKIEFEIFKRESLEEMKQKQEEFLTLQKSSEQQMTQLNQTQRDLNVLKAQISSDAETKQIFKEIQTNQLQIQNQINETSTKVGEINHFEVIKTSGNPKITNPIYRAGLLAAKNEELVDLKKIIKELSIALQKSYELSINRTTSTKNYNIFPNYNKN